MGGSYKISDIPAKTSAKPASQKDENERFEIHGMNLDIRNTPHDLQRDFALAPLMVEIVTCIKESSVVRLSTF